MTKRERERKNVSLCMRIIIVAAILVSAFIARACMDSDAIKERERQERFQWNIHRKALPGPRPADKPFPGTARTEQNFQRAIAFWEQISVYKAEWIEQLKRFENEPLFLGVIQESVAHRDKLRPDVMEVGYGITGAEVKQAICYGLLPKNATLPQKMSKSEADQWFSTVTLPTYERSVMEIVKVPLTIEQRFALISFCHNLGKGNLARMAMQDGRLKDSNYADLADYMLKYVNAGSSKNVPGLIRRRNFEADLWNSGTHDNSVEVATR